MFRVIVLVKKELNACAPKDLQCDSPLVWVQVGKILIGGIYRQFSDRNTKQKGITFELEQLKIIAKNLEAATSTGRQLILAGDLNLDAARGTDLTYYRKDCFDRWKQIANINGISYVANSTPTWKSFGIHGGLAKCSILDHAYTSLGLADHTTVEVRSEAISDHFPLLITARLEGEKDKKKLVSIERRNFRRLDKKPVLRGPQQLELGTMLQ